ncbi:MAG: hypothetical protein K2M04_07670 [Muribaculaceae bacterium]|nr:hypothetical protein [Muribaculaceae bacterium]
MSRLVSLAILIFAMLFTDNASAVNPDFAFPQNVERQANADLLTALDRQDVSATVDALIRLTIASNSIDPANVVTSLARIDSLRTSTSSLPERSLLSAMMADIYRAMYQARRWDYDRRNMPLSPLPADPSEWSGEQYRQIITSLLEESVMQPDTLAAIPLSDYRAIVAKYDEAQKAFYPTLYDFVAWNAIDIFTDLTPNSRVLSPDWIFRFIELMPLKANRLDPMVSRIFSLYANLRRIHSDDPAPLLLEETRRVLFTDRFVFVAGEKQGYIAENNRIYQALSDIYGQFNPQTPYALLTLTEMNSYTGSEAQQSDLYRLALDWKKKWGPSTPASMSANAIISRISAPSARVSAPASVSPSRPFKAAVEWQNAKKVILTLRYNGPQGAVVERKEVTSTREIPFNATDTLEFTAPRYGRYFLGVEIPGQTSNSHRHDEYNITATDLATSLTSVGEKTMIITTDILTGRPVEGAQMKFTDYRGNPIVVSDATVRSDAHGISTVTIPEGKRVNRVQAFKGSDRFAQGVYMGWRGNTDNDRRFMASVVTDRSLYHPGDSMECVALTSWRNLRSHGVADSLKVRMTLYNADSEPVDTVDSVTDMFGRATAMFRLPKEGKTGAFMVQVTDVSTSNYLGSGRVTVSDYKLPSFRVEIEEIDRSSATARITGKAMGYNGMPVADARVVAMLRARANSGWRTALSSVYFTDTLTTDHEGTFVMEVDSTIISLSPLPSGVIVADFDVTSMSGETHSASTAFATGKPYAISLNVTSQPIDVAAPVAFDASAQTPTGKPAPIDVELRYRLMLNERTVKEGDYISGKTIDWSDVDPGSYTLTLFPADESLAAPSSSHVLLYSSKKNNLPVDDVPFWTPVNQVVTDADGKAVINVLADVTSPTLYVISATVDSLLPTQVKTLAPGWNKIEVNIPAGDNTLAVRLYATYDLSSITTPVTVTRPSEPLQITSKSFRNRLVPGTEETWNFSVSLGDVCQIEAAMVAGMWNAALDALEPHSINPHFPSLPMPMLNVNGYNGHCYESAWTRGGRTAPLFGVNAPEFNLYGERWLGGRRYRKFTNTLMVRGAATSSSDDVVVEEEVVMDEVMTATEMAAPMMVGAVKRESAKMAYSVDADSAVAEEVAEAEGDNGMADAGGAGEANSPAEEPAVRYRDAEIPLAFFRPALTTEPSGIVNLEFTVPEANATWQFEAFSYDKALKTGRISHIITALKPVVVKSRSPRFLRRGDKALIIGEVSNATDSAIKAEALVEVLTNEGSMIAERKVALELEGKSTASVSIDLDVPPANVDTLIYRIAAVTDRGSSDGEKVAIPVLDVWQPVVDSTPFYLAPDSSSLVVTPEIPAGSEVNVLLTDNAALEVAKALPAIEAKGNTTSVEIAEALYSAATTAWLASKYPWITEDLKGAEDAKLRIPGLIEQLSKFESKKGGWQWIGGADADDRPSMWVTENVLSMLADLADLGALPESNQLKYSARRAISWLDKEEKKSYDKSPDSDFTRYSWLRLRLEPISEISSSARTIINATGKRLAREWKNLDIAGKGIAAVVLEKTGHVRDARLVAESLRQLATVNPVQGMCWRQLDTTYAWSMGKIGITSNLLQAFNTIDPGRPEVDAIRQWLVMRKLALDWGATIGTVRAVSSILSTGTDWTRPSDPASWHWTDNGTKLVVEKTGVHPAWGAVMARYTGAMTEVPAHSCQELSIEKRLFRRVADANGGVTWEETKELKVGDRVRVDLLIKADTDMDYVTVDDSRAACLEPVKQLPGWEWADGLRFYRENRDSSTRLFITHLVRGTYRISVEMDAATAGTFTSGIATATCQQAPQLTAHTAGATIRTLSE